MNEDMTTGTKLMMQCAPTIGEVIEAELKSMAKTLEYVKRRCAINEEVLHDLGQLVGAHLPAIAPQLGRIGEAWDAAIDKLDADMLERECGDKMMDYEEFNK
jgi:hypothetical protein